MSEPTAFDVCVQLLIAECRVAGENIEGRIAQEFFQAVMGLRLDPKQSYTAWQEILRRWEEAKSRKDAAVSFHQVLLHYFLDSRHLKDPMVTEFKEFQRLRLSSTTDHLTGVYNRRFFDAMVEKEVPRAFRYAEDLSLVLIDLNHFKQVNDTLGHEFGDRLLALTGKILKELLRVPDSAYRVGGDEFAVLLPQTSHLGGLAFAERLRQRFEEETKAIEELRIPVSVAYGVASCPREATDAKTLFALADQRLYDFKRAIGSPRCAPRKFKRIPTDELGALVILHAGDRDHEGRLLDFSFGGVGLRLADEIYLPERLTADLHLPVLPTASVALRKVYARKNGKGFRIGCAFLDLASTPPA